MASSIVQLIAELALFFVLALGAVAVHEAGHVLAGVVCGFRIIAIRIGPLRLHLAQKEFLRLSPSNLTSGAVFAQFQDLPGKYASWRAAFYLLGGSLANFAMVAVTFVRWNTTAGVILEIFAAISAMVGLISLFPVKTRMGQSDGAKLVGLAFSKTRRQETVARLSISARLDEVKRLCRSEQFREVYPKLEALIADLHAILPTTADRENANPLIRLKEQIGLRLERDTSQTEAPTMDVPESV